MARVAWLNLAKSTRDCFWLPLSSHQLCRQVRAVQVSCHLHPPLRLRNIDPACWLKQKKGSRLSKPSAWGNFSASPTWSTRTRPTTGCGARSTSLWVHMDLFWQLSRDGNLHGSGMSLAMTVSPSGHLRGWATPWSTEEMLDGQHQRLEYLPMPELLCRKDWNRISAESSQMSAWRPNRSRDWTELNRTWGISRYTPMSDSIRRAQVI